MKTIKEFEKEVHRFIFLALSSGDNFVIYMSENIQPPHKNYDLFHPYGKYGSIRQNTPKSISQECDETFIWNIKTWVKKYKNESFSYEKDKDSIAKMKAIRTELDTLLSFTLFASKQKETI